MKFITVIPKRICVLAILFLASVFTASAADFMVDGIAYNVIGESEVEVTKLDSVKYVDEIIIPATVVQDGITYRVTRIGKGAFSGCNELTLIDIPEGVTEIGTSAFSGCTILEDVDLPNSLVSIEMYAFQNCTSFTIFDVPRNVAKIHYRAFWGCRGLKYFTCSSLSHHFKAVDGVLYSKDMSKLCFYPPAATASTFDVPSPVAVIEDYCFADNNSLAEVNFPESLRWIGMNILRGNTKIKSVYIPDGVTHMGVTVFGSCTNLESVHLPASLDSLMNSTFWNCKKLAEVTIPRNVSYIDEQAFLQASGLITVNFEEGSRLKTIGARAFYECTSLETLNMPDSVTVMGHSVFSKCSALKSVHISESLVDIGSAMFWDCPSLEEGILPGGVRSLKNIYVYCPSLKKVVIGSKDSAPGVTLIENCGVANCENIEYLELGANIDSLEHLALVDLINLKVLISWAPVPPRCHDYWSSFDPSPQYMTAPLYVPKASLEAYRTANEWKNFKTIVAIEDVGDVDGDGTIAIGDVTALIDQLLEGEIDRAAYCDVNLDGNVTIADVTALIDQLLGNS